jgi:hypothetical protein
MTTPTKQQAQDDNTDDNKPQMITQMATLVTTPDDNKPLGHNPDEKSDDNT